ncbi:MAG: DUF4397 domain-containing protein [Actinomycetota bacterium]
MKRILLAAAVLISVVFTTVPAGAQDTSEVYVLHGIPGVNVDVYVNGELTLPAFEPETVAGPLELPAGDYQIQIFAEGADPEADTAVIDVTAPVPGGESVSVIAHLDADGNPTLGAFVNDLSETGAGNGRVTVRHTAAAPAVDIVAGGAAVAGLEGAENGDEAAVELPAGDYPTGIAAAGTTEALVEAPITVVEGVNLVVYAIGTLDDGSFALLTQTFDGLGGGEEGGDEEPEAPTAINAGDSGLAADGSSAGILVAVVALGVVALLGAVAVPVAVRHGRRAN